MRKRILRSAIMAALGILLIAMLLPEKAEEEKDAGITVSVPAEEAEEVYVYICSADALRQRDGSYLVEVEFMTDTAQGFDGMRMVTVFCGDQKAVFSLTKENLDEVHTVSFAAADQPEEVKVEVRYHETEAGLLLMSDGDGLLCGKAIAPVDGDRVLRLSGGRAGASYRIYRVAELHELLSGMVVLSMEPSPEEMELYGVGERFVTTLILDENGNATCNFTLEGFGDGVYLVAGEGDAYYICLPLVEATGEFRGSAARLSLREDQQNAA